MIAHLSEHITQLTVSSVLFLNVILDVDAGMGIFNISQELMNCYKFWMICHQFPV